MNIVICDYIEQYCKEIDKIIWNMADEFEEHINVVSFNSVQELYKYLKNNNYSLNIWEQAAGSKTTQNGEAVMVLGKVRDFFNQASLSILLC